MSRSSTPISGTTSAESEPGSRLMPIFMEYRYIGALVDAARRSARRHATQCRTGMPTARAAAARRPAVAMAGAATSARSRSGASAPTIPFWHSCVTSTVWPGATRVARSSGTAGACPVPDGPSKNGKRRPVSEFETQHATRPRAVLPEAVTGASERFGDDAAFATPDGWPLTFRDLDRLSDEAAVGLRRRGVGEGDVVVLSLPSVVDYVVAYAAAAKVGAVTAGLNSSLAAPERRRLVELAEPKLVLATTELHDCVPDDVPTEVVVEADHADAILRELRVAGETPPTLAGDPDRPVAVVFTSGTTGIPKGAVFTDRQLAAIVEMDTAGRWGGGTDQLSSTLFPHIGFMTKLPWYLRTGTTTHLLKKWRAAEVLQIVDKYRMASIAAVAPQVALM